MTEMNPGVSQNALVGDFIAAFALESQLTESGASEADILAARQDRIEKQRLLAGEPIEEITPPDVVEQIDAPEVPELQAKPAAKISLAALLAARQPSASGTLGKVYQTAADTAAVLSSTVVNEATDMHGMPLEGTEADYLLHWADVFRDTLAEVLSGRVSIDALPFPEGEPRREKAKQAIADAAADTPPSEKTPEWVSLFFEVQTKILRK